MRGFSPAALAAIALVGATVPVTIPDPFDRIRHTPITNFLDGAKPEKRSRTNSHKQNARKKKKGGAS